MKNRFHHAHLHGFASGPLSRKGLFLAQAFQARDLKLHLPDLNRPSFAKLTYTGALGAMDELDRARNDARPWRISGSSMGGYLAARWAQLHPERMDRLVLLCPGFNMASRWPTLIGEEAMARWERDGAYLLKDGAGQTVAVHHGFIREGREHPPFPEVPCPTLIIHGTRDETVPIEGSRTYAEARPGQVTLVEVDDDHGLLGSVDRIVDEIHGFYKN